MLTPGQRLYFRGEREHIASVKPDGKLVCNGTEGSIHQIARDLVGGSPCNGWDLWFFEDECGEMQTIDELRETIRKKMK